MLFENFCGQSYTGSLTTASDRTINWYMRKVEAPGGKAPYVLESTPGYALALTVGGASEVILGVVVATVTSVATLPRPFVLTRDGTTVRLYSVAYASGSYTATLLASWAESLAENSVNYSTLLWSGKEFLCIVRGAGYVYNPSTATATNLTGSGASAGFPAGNVTAAVAVDGYFIVASNFATGNQFEVSSLFDGTTWSALNVGVARGAGDTILALLPLHRELWVFGLNHAEVYYDAGSVAGTTFPWARNNNVYLEVGCVAPATLCRFADTAAWVGADESGQGVVYLLDGYAPRRISTHAVERALAQVSSSTTIFSSFVSAYAMQREGHHFYVLNADVGTWVYDLSTGLWHEWLRWTGSVYGAHPLVHGCAVTSLGNGSSATQLGWTGADNKLYAISTSYLTDNGAAIKRTRRAPHLVGEQKRLRYAQFALDCNVGVQADGTAQSGTVSLNLSWSDDGGMTFNTPQSVSLAAANYTARPVWRRLGLARDRVFEVTTTSNYNVTLNNAFLELEAGTS
jgi:Phage stabilisation protein